DHRGTFIHALAGPLGEGTNNQAGIEAAIIGITWCIGNGYTKVHLEADSSALIHWVTNETTPPWELKMLLLKLKQLCDQCAAISFSHVYREANCLADTLSKHIHNLTALTNFHSFHSLPSQIRGQIQQDFLETPAFRHKKTNKIIIPPHLASPSTSHGYG
ncbi:hypothetical protein A4A49_51258, partial [Nicotiana attenuata]